MIDDLPDTRKRMATLDLETLRLARGGHKSLEEGVCVMEAAAYIAGEPWSDHPKCVSPVIAAFCRRWNDDLSDDDRQKLTPYVRRVIGTNTGPADDERRAWMVTDWMVRVYLPSWLRAAKLDAQAAAVAALPELVGRDSWGIARSTIEAARKSSAAAWDAAGAAAGAAAWDAAWAAAGAAARDAAWDAARAAARAAAGAAAWDAAGAAAGAAAWDAAWDAAGAAARDALKPTVVAIQASAFDLLDRLIAVGTTGGTP